MIEIRVDFAVTFDMWGKSIDICRHELCILPVFKKLLDDWVDAKQIIKRIDIGAPFLSVRESKLLVKDESDLL